MDVFAAILFALRIQSAYATAFPGRSRCRRHSSMALCGTVYGKGPPCSTSSTSAVLLPVRGTERGLLVRLRRLLHCTLPQSRPLTGSRVKKVSTKCRLSVDHVYSGTLRGTLILVPFSCHKTGTSSTSMERLQTGSISNNVKQLGRIRFMRSVSGDACRARDSAGSNPRLCLKKNPFFNNL